MNNINKIGHNPCSSCGVCVISCPHKAVLLKQDENGFYRPIVNNDICTDCGICTKVCYKYLKEKNPFENAFKDKSIYAAWSKDITTVKTSSSGGVGYELTSYFYHAGYKICGVIFDAPNNICKHIIAESDENLEAIKTSKYLQSYTVEAFSQFKKGEKYLVVGTPCQIYGLRKWSKLKKLEDDFILVDFFCHGTPTHNLWKKYKEFLCEKYNLNSSFKYVNFRSNQKSTWHKNAMLISDCYEKEYYKDKAFVSDLFFQFFMSHSCLNDACYSCQLRLDNCAADIRIADFWGSKYANNENGVSLVITNTKRGELIWREIEHLLTVENCNFKDLETSQNGRFIEKNQQQRNVILKELREDKSLIQIYNQHIKNKLSVSVLLLLRKIEIKILSHINSNR
ncbi:F420H2-dehydrogenase [Bacteroidia bacterium]|nr:F420H2-dehydrogenase [Bacteroidia bacterium]